MRAATRARRASATSCRASACCDANCFLYSSAPKMREDGGCGWEWLEDRTFCFVRRPADGTAKLVAFTDPELLTEQTPSPPSSPSSSPPPPPPLTAVTFILRMPVAAGPVLASVIVNGQRYPMYPDAGTVEVSPLAQAAGATLPTLSPPPPPEGAAGVSRSPAAPSRPSRRRCRRRPKIRARAPKPTAAPTSVAPASAPFAGAFCCRLGGSAPASEHKDATAPTTMDEVVPRECGAVEPAGLTVPETTHREGVVQGGGGRQVVGPFAFGSCSAYPDGEQPPSSPSPSPTPPPPSPPPAALSPLPPPSPGKDCPPPPPKPLGCAFVKGQGDGSRRRLDPAAAGGASGWRLSECADLVVRLAPEASGATINFDDGACYAELEMTRAVPGCATYQCRPRDWRALLARGAKRAAADENALVVPPPSDDSTALAGGAYDCHQCSQMWTCRFGGWPPPPPPSPIVRPPPPSPPPPPAPPAPPPPPAPPRAAAATGVEDLRRPHVRGRRAPLGEGRRRLPRGVRRRCVVRGVRGGRRTRGSVRHVGDVHAAQLRAEGGLGGARSPCAAARLLGARRVVRRPHRDHQERRHVPEVDGAVSAHPPRHAARAAGRRARRPPLLPPGGRGGGVVLHDRSGPAPRGMHAAELRRLLHGARPLVLLGVARMLLGVCVTRHFNS